MLLQDMIYVFRQSVLLAQKLFGSIAKFRGFQASSLLDMRLVVLDCRLVRCPGWIARYVPICKKEVLAKAP